MGRLAHVCLWGLAGDGRWGTEPSSLTGAKQKVKAVLKENTKLQVSRRRSPSTPVKYGH